MASGNTIVLICNSRKIQSDIYTYMHAYLLALVLGKKKTLNLTKIRLHLQEIMFIEIKYNKVTTSNQKINSI